MYGPDPLFRAKSGYSMLSEDLTDVSLTEAAGPVLLTSSSNNGLTPRRNSVNFILHTGNSRARLELDLIRFGNNHLHRQRCRKTSPVVELKRLDAVALDC